MHGGAGGGALSGAHRPRRSGGIGETKGADLDTLDWGKLKTFHAACEAGSLTGAAEKLGLSQSAVSRQIQSLEDELGVALFHRHARGLLRTEPGERLYAMAHEMASRAALAEAVVRETHDRPSGDLRVTTTIGLGQTWLIDQLPAFYDQYPDVRVHLLLDDKEVDLSMLEADVALRPWQPRDPGLIQRKIYTSSQALYASHDYVRRFGAPQTPEELAGHSLVLYGMEKGSPLPSVDWAADLGVPAGTRRRDARVSVDSMPGVLRAVAIGLGIGALPDYMTRGHDELVRVLTTFEGPSYDIYFVYPEELKGAKRLQVFRDFIVAAAAKLKAG